MSRSSEIYQSLTHHGSGFLAVLPTRVVMLGRFGAPTWLAVPEQTNNHSASATQTDVALSVVAGVVGGHDVAKTGHCELAYKNSSSDLKRVVLQYVQVPHPYTVTIPIGKQTRLA